jgi:hypothetical protein
MYEYNAKVIEVIDGDTVIAEVDLGFYLKARLKLRLLYVNALRSSEKQCKRV